MGKRSTFALVLVACATPPTPASVRWTEVRPNVWQLSDADIAAAIPDLASAGARLSACSATGSDLTEITYQPLIVTDGVVLPRVVTCRGLPPAGKASCQLEKSGYRYFARDPARYVEVAPGLAPSEAFAVIQQFELGSYTPRGTIEGLVAGAPVRSIRAIGSHHYVLSWRECSCAAEVLVRRSPMPGAPLEIVDQSGSCT